MFPRLQKQQKAEAHVTSLGMKGFRYDVYETIKISRWWLQLNTDTSRRKFWMYQLNNIALTGDNTRLILQYSVLRTVSEIISEIMGWTIWDHYFNRPNTINYGQFHMIQSNQITFLLLTFYLLEEHHQTGKHWQNIVLEMHLNNNVDKGNWVKPIACLAFSHTNE